MQTINVDPQLGEEVAPVWGGRREDAIQRDAAQFLSRLDFRHISSHISHRKPGYYLILLRNELRHRSLREKPALID